MDKRYIRQGKCLRCGWCCKNEACEHFIDEANVTICAIFGQDDRPKKCTVYPSAPPVLNKNCGFYFLDRFNDNKVTKEKVWL